MEPKNEPVLGFSPSEGSHRSLSPAGSETPRTPFTVCSPLSVALKKAESTPKLPALQKLQHRRSISLSATPYDPECSPRNYEEWRSTSVGSGIPIPETRRSTHSSASNAIFMDSQCPTYRETAECASREIMMRRFSSVEEPELTDDDMTDCDDSMMFEIEVPVQELPFLGLAIRTRPADSRK